MLIIAIKEDSNLVLFGIGLYLTLKRNFKIGVISVIIPFVLFPATILLIIPGFPHPNRINSIAFLERWSNYGDDVKTIVLNMLNPYKNYNEIFKAEKIKSLLGLLRQFIFIPIFSYKTIILILPYIFFVLVSNQVTMYRLEYHYTLIIIPILYYAFFENFNILKKYHIKYFENILACLLILTSAYSVRNIYINMPEDMKAFNYHNKFDMALSMISQIPPNDGISVSKTLITRVPVRYHRNHLPYGLDKAKHVIVYKYEKTTSFDEKITPILIDSLRKSDSWKVVKEDSAFILFDKISK